MSIVEGPERDFPKELTHRRMHEKRLADGFNVKGSAAASGPR